MWKPVKGAPWGCSGPTKPVGGVADAAPVSLPGRLWGGSHVDGGGTARSSSAEDPTVRSRPRVPPQRLNHGDTCPHSGLPSHPGKAQAGPDQSWWLPSFPASRATRRWCLWFSRSSHITLHTARCRSCAGCVPLTSPGTPGRLRERPPLLTLVLLPVTKRFRSKSRRVSKYFSPEIRNKAKKHSCELALEKQGGPSAREGGSGEATRERLGTPRPLSSPCIVFWTLGVPGGNVGGSLQTPRKQPRPVIHGVGVDVGGVSFN